MRDVRKRIETVIAGAIWDGNCSLVQDLHKSWRITAWAHIASTFIIMHAKTHKWRAGNEVLRVFVDFALLFFDRKLVGWRKKCSQIRLILNEEFGIDGIFCHITLSGTETTAW